MRPGRLRVPFLLVILAAILAGWRIQIAVEDRVAATIRRAGLTVGDVRFSWFGSLRLVALGRVLAGGVRLDVDAVDLHWRVLGGRDPRSHLSRVVLRGVAIERRPLRVRWPEADFDVLSWTRDDSGDRLSLRQASGTGQIDGQWSRANAEGALDVAGLDLAGADVQWDGDTILSPGRWEGRATFAGSGETFRHEGALHGEALRLTAPRPMQPGGEGDPTAMDLAWRAHGGGGALTIEQLLARIRGLEVSLHGSLEAPPERRLDLQLKAHGELGETFRTLGLRPPLPDLHGDRLGALALELGVRGPLNEPTAVVVDSRLRFTPEPEVVRALAYLRGPFEYRPASSPGLVIDVGEGAPDFIAIADVPPLFERALLLSEDAGFWHHPGIDLAEIAAAWAENEEGGRRLRGASTLTQQLVKNVLLSSERTYGRKLKEAALALMVDASVPKPRLLEIYVNVIEWGPHLHGLVPAARHYFGKRPEALTPKETAFLVCLIPSPVRYHQAYVAGRLGPGMELLVHRLLAKLHSVGALSDEDYERARQEDLHFTPEPAGL